MPIVRDLIQKVVIGKTPGHQPATLHGSIANIMASMEVLDLREQQFLAAAQNDFMARLASGELDTDAKKQKLLKAYAEELLRKYPDWKNSQVWLREPDCTEVCNSSSRQPLFTELVRSVSVLTPQRGVIFVWNLAIIQIVRSSFLHNRQGTSCSPQ